MVGKKKLLSKIMYYSSILPLVRFFSSNKLLVYNFHRIYQNTIDSEFDDGVYGMSLLQFTENMKWLKKNTDILSVDDLFDNINKQKKFSNPSTLVTFDDGYVDNYTLAYPVLKKLGIPAIFFIPTNIITTRQMGWWDLIAYLIKKTKKTSIIYNDKIYSLDNLDNAIRLFQKKMKIETYDETNDLVLTLSKSCDVPLPDIEVQSKELMTWDQICEVSVNGIDIGSHTDSHRVLSTISIDEQKEEMISSRLIIEGKINKTVRTIAYPVGNSAHFTIETMKIASECGYNGAFSFNTGINYESDFSPFDIKRIMPPQNIELFASISVFPKLFL